MKKYYDLFQEFLQKEERDASSDIFSIDVLLVVSYAFERNKEDILSDIRAIEGITTVKVLDNREVGDKDYSTLYVKVDTTPLKEKSIIKLMLKIKKQALRIRGVSKFEYTRRPVKM